MANPACLEMPFEDRFGLLVDAEWASRKNNRMTRLIRAADYPYPGACEENIWCLRRWISYVVKKLYEPMPRRIGFRGWSAGIHAWPDTARIPAAHLRSAAARRQWVRLPLMQPPYAAKFRTNLLHRVEIRLHRIFRTPSAGRYRDRFGAYPAVILADTIY